MINKIEILFTSKNCRQAKLYLLDAWSQALLFTGKQVFQFGFSLRFPKFPGKFKNQLNTSIGKCGRNFARSGLSDK